MERKRLWLLLLVVCVLGPSAAYGQYDIPHGTFSCGSGVRGGTNIIYDTAAQTAAAVSTGASYTVESGFWYMAYVTSTVDVAFASFACEYRDDAVVLLWSVSADAPFEGFNVYRAEGKSEEFERLNEEPLPPRNECTYTDEVAIPGRTYTYRVGALDDGGGEYLSLEASVTLPPKPLTLYQNYPNPFNPVTTVSFFMPRDERVDLVIYNVEGKTVRTLVRESRKAGRYTVPWNGRNNLGHPVSSGVYYYRLRVGKDVLTRKMVIIR